MASYESTINDKSGSQPSDRVSIPDKQPEVEKSPAYKMDYPNYADNEVTAANAVRWIKSGYHDFEDQNAWTKCMTNMDSADEMMRAAVNRIQLMSDESDNTESTRSNVKSADFHSDLTVINAGETSIMLGKDNQLPVVYEPLPDSEDFSAELGALQAEEYNAVLSYTMEKSNMRDEIRKHIWRTNKYGNSPIEMQWDWRKEERTVRKATKYEPIELADGTTVEKPVKFKKETKIVTVADHPKLIVHDMAHVRFDSQIEDMQNQSLIVIRTQKQLSDLWGEQITGRFQNMDKVTTDQLYSEEGRDHVESDRQDNAGEGSDKDKPTTLFDVRYGWVRVPVEDKTGEWNEKTQISHWYEYVMIGNIEKNPVLVRLSPLPYSSGQIPFSVTHALEDDKGALHIGYAELVKSIIAQEMTNTDQAIDNVTLRQQAPWIAEKGSLGKRDFTFNSAGNQMWWKRAGAEDPHVVEVPDTTMITLNMLAHLEDKRRKTMGTNKPLVGEPLGGRASAAESISVTEQGLKPSLEASKYKANQIFPFIAFWVSEMWKDFGNPDLVINLTGKSPVKQVKPADIYGDMRVRVTAIKQFQDGMLRRKEADNFIQTLVPMLLEHKVMSPADLGRFAKEEMSSRDFEGIENYITVRSNADAQHVAKAENQSIVMNGVFDLPQPEEDHQTHLDEHIPYAGSAALAIEKEDPRYANIKNLQLHIQQHQQMMAGAQQQSQQAQPQLGQPLDGQGAARTEGEAFGDAAGAVENVQGVATL